MTADRIHSISQTLLSDYQCRKGKSYKKRFYTYIEKFAKDNDIAVSFQSDHKLISSTNIVFNDPEKASMLITAHYDTCAVLPFPNICTPLNFGVYLAYNILVVVLMYGSVFLFGDLLQMRGIDRFAAKTVELFLILFFLYWMIAGRSSHHTANDNTSGVAAVLSLIASMDPEKRKQICFVLFDNEEAGLLGSSSFSKTFKNYRTVPVFNLDCVGDGDHFLFKYKKKDAEQSYIKACMALQAKDSDLIVTSKGYYPSDQENFKHGIGIAAMKKDRNFGIYYFSKIHTKHDTVLQEENIAKIVHTLESLIDLYHGSQNEDASSANPL